MTPCMNLVNQRQTSDSQSTCVRGISLALKNLYLEEFNNSNVMNRINIHIYLSFKIFHGDDCVLGGHVIVIEIY